MGPVIRMRQFRWPQEALRRHAWKALFGLLATALVALVAIRWWVGPAIATETVTRRDFVQTVVASGHVEAPNRVDLGAQITATVSRIPVSEGQVVKAGELLIELESAELRASLRQADVAVVQAQARLRQLREVQAPVAEQALRQAQINLDNARSQLIRNEDLFRQGFIGQAALDDTRKAVDLADAQVRSTQKQLETVRLAGSDYALAEAALAQAQASAQAARARVGYATITAPADGTLIARNVEVGDVVQPGKVLMTLSPAGRTQIVVDIDEKNLRLLALGQKALASSDAYPQQRFAAELVYINPGVNAQTGAVEVKLDVAAPPPTLRQDMTVSVDIEVARRPQALIVPSSVVHDADGAAPWVLRLDGARAVRRTVRVGLHSGGFSEVLEGLAEGDRVIPAATLVNDGARLRVAASAPRR
jgi:HlyD family secretion protein